MPDDILKHTSIIYMPYRKCPSGYFIWKEMRQIDYYSTLMEHKLIIPEVLHIMAKANDYGTGIPKHEVESLARCLLPEIERFFESEEGKQEFEQWRLARTKTRKPVKH